MQEGSQVEWNCGDVDVDKLGANQSKCITYPKQDLAELSSQL